MKLIQKSLALFAVLGIGIQALLAQDIIGDWHGILSITGTPLRLVFHIEKTRVGYKSTMDSPDQNAFDIPVATTIFRQNNLTIYIPSIGMTYEGEYVDDTFDGTFTQGALSVPMTLTRTPQEAKPLHRPQEPQPPFPYRSEEVTFVNPQAPGVVLAGTLTLPNNDGTEGITATGGFPAVILISGSGAQDRNEEIMGHKPFLVIADYLTRQGLVVLRYDDRGTAQSTGDFATATTADFATDVESAITYLKTRREIDHNKIGLIGHSEGGIIAPMVAARSADVAFIVMLAGTGIRGDNLLLLQTEQLSRSSGMSEDQLAKQRLFNAKIYEKIVSTDDYISLDEMTALMMTMKDDMIEMMTSIEENLSDIANEESIEELLKTLARETATPWIQYFIRYDPASALTRVSCPVLAVNGTHDLQVAATENLSAIRKALERGGNQKFTIKEYPNLNHLFQHCPTGLPANYATIEETFSPEVLNDIAEWILSLF